MYFCQINIIISIIQSLFMIKIIPKYLLVGALALTSTCLASAADPVIYGSVVNAEAWTITDAGKIGLYKIPTAADQSFELVKAGVNAEYGGVLADNSYYAGYEKSSFLGTTPTIVTYDVETWEQKSSIGTEQYCLATDVTYDPVGKKVYGCFKNASGDGYQFGTINYKFLSVDRLGSLNTEWWSLAADVDGTIYGFAKTATGSALYKLNKNKGTGDLIGETGCKPFYATSAVIDPKSGRLFWTVAEEDGSAGIYEVDKSTGAATLLRSFADGEQVCGLFILTAPAESDAPSACGDLEASFPNGSLSGTVSFTVPSKLFGGGTGQGKVNYRVESGEEVLAQGETTYGSKVSAPVSVSADGKYTFSVILSNAAGDSPAATIEAIIGHGSPKAPVVTASYADGKFLVKWTTPEPVDGGYIDPENVTYKVVRYPSQVVVASQTSATSVENAVDEPTGLTKFWYGVTATYRGKNSAEGQSNVVTLGALIPPYEQVFDSAEKAEDHTIINANNDEKYDGSPRTWEFYANTMSIGMSNAVTHDDWLISPPVTLQSGKSYVYTLKAFVQSDSYPEVLEVKLGNATTAEAMTTSVIEPLTLTNTEVQEFTGIILPETTGKYYIGIHAISPADRYRLYVEGYSIGEPKSAAVPQAPTDLKLVPDANGAFIIKASVTAPTKDIQNEDLESLDRLELWRGSTLVKSFSPIEPGATVTFTDEMAQGGDTEYRAIAYNSHGGSQELKGTVYVGINKPSAPVKADIVETDKDGEVTISWPAVDTDFAGNPLNPDLVSYTIYQLQAETHVVIADDIAGTSYTMKAVEPGDQKFVHYFVSAQTERGVSDLTETDLIPCGTPYSLPYRETFANADTDYLMAFTEDGSAMWSLLSDDNKYGVASHSADRGLLLCRGVNEDDFSVIHTLKIHVDDILKPGVMFFTYNLTSDGADNNVVEIQVFADGEWTTLKSAVISTLGTEAGWYLVSASLEEYKGKDVLVGIKVITKSYHETFIDDLTVGSMVANDLSIVEVNAPKAVGFNKEFNISVTIENKGTDAQKDFEVKLFADNAVALTEKVASLAAGATTTVNFSRIYDALTEAGSTFYVEVANAGDESTADNICEAFTVEVSVPTLPAVSSLKGEINTDGSILLRWKAPSTEGYEAVAVTDDFESYEAFITPEIGPWLAIDEDGGVIGTISDVDIPNIPYTSQQTWWVMDGDWKDFNKSFHAHSGSKYLAQMFVVDPESGASIPCEDWLISPELTGKAQNISFYARSYSKTYPETFEVLYSTGGTTIGDFKTIRTVSNISPEWSLYSFNLPEGSKHFAIVARSQNKFMLFIDDITYTPLSAGDLEVKGYNIWRNGIKLNSEPVTDLYYLDDDKADTKADYRLTVVYDKGESKACPKATLELSGLGSLAGSADIEVVGGNGMLTVVGADGLMVEVFNTSGQTVAAKTGCAHEIFSLPAGLYIVRVNDQVFKAVVK